MLIDVRDLRPEAFHVLVKNDFLYRILFFPMKLKANRAYACADELIAVSNEYLKRGLSANKKSKNASAIYIGATLELFYQGIKAYGEEIEKKTEEFWLTYVGTIGTSYDFETIIEAMVSINKLAPNVKLKIIGQGPEEEKLKEYASIWQNCALRGDVNKIVVGRYSNVQDNSVLHVDDDKACILGDYVTIGHGAIVHASTIEDNVLVGMGAIVLSGCHVGSGSIIAAGAVVKENTVIPPNSLVVGIPARVVRTDETQIERIHNQALKYKHLWTIEYGMLPDAGGEEYDKNAKIV